MIKEGPVNFRIEEMLPLLDGRKTQARRAIKPQPHLIDGPIADLADGPDWWNQDFKHPECIISKARRCPYGIPGDRLWVREPYKLHEDESGQDYIRYKADDSLNSDCIPNRQYWMDDTPVHSFKRWCPSIHLPQWASRITLVITDVRVERIQKISESDILAEGFQLQGKNTPDGKTELRMAGNDKHLLESLMASAMSKGKISPEHVSFVYFWNSINLKRGFGWKVNPWVWVILFKIINGA